MWVRSTSVPARYLMTFTIISAVASAITLRLTWHFPAIFGCRVTRYFESSTTATLTGSRADRLVKMPPLVSRLPAYRQLRYWQKLTIARAGKSVGVPPLTSLPQARSLLQMTRRSALTAAMEPPAPRLILTAEITMLAERFSALKLTAALDRKSTRLNSSHVEISYAVFCLKKKKKKKK